MAQKKATEVEHNGETIEVPAAFERTDLATWFGGVPESFDVDRIFRGEEGELRAESYLGDGEWVEAALHTDEWHETFNAQNDRGWVAEHIDGAEDPEYPNAEHTDRYPGETVWVRGENTEGDR